MTRSWTCGRCGVRTSFSSGTDHPAEPDGWAEVDGEWRCLACRRDDVVDTVAVTGRPGAATTRRRALAEFELLRDPSASDRVIAKRVKCSTGSVTPIRAALRASGRLRGPEPTAEH
jgi:hypothetical protein